MKKRQAIKIRKKYWDSIWNSAIQSATLGDSDEIHMRQYKSSSIWQSHRIFEKLSKFQKRRLVNKWCSATVVNNNE